MYTCTVCYKFRLLLLPVYTYKYAYLSICNNTATATLYNTQPLVIDSYHPHAYTRVHAVITIVIAIAFGTHEVMKCTQQKKM